MGRQRLPLGRDRGQAGGEGLQAASIAGPSATAHSHGASRPATRRVPGCARVEHVFGHRHTSMGGTIVRTIGVRAGAKVGLMNLVYNMSRERVAAAPA